MHRTSFFTEDSPNFSQYLHFYEVCFVRLPIDVFFWYYLVSLGDVKLLLTLFKRRITMKISQGIEHFFNYQRLNVKKKYVQELRIHHRQFSEPFRRHRAIFPRIRRHPGIYDRGVRWNETVHQKITIHPPGGIFQLHQEFGRFRLSKSLWQSGAAKAFQGREVHPVQNPWKRCGRWNHLHVVGRDAHK